MSLPPYDWKSGKVVVPEFKNDGTVVSVKEKTKSPFLRFLSKNLTKLFLLSLLVLSCSCCSVYFILPTIYTIIQNFR